MRASLLCAVVGFVVGGAAAGCQPGSDPAEGQSSPLAAIIQGVEAGIPGAAAEPMLPAMPPVAACREGHHHHHHHPGEPGDPEDCTGPFTIDAREAHPLNNPVSSYRGDGLIPGEQPMLHVVGIYESGGAHSFGYHPAGQALVHIGPTLRPVVLGLSSYEPTEWILDLDPGADIRSVVLLGYYPQEVTSPIELPVTDLSHGQTQSCSYCWPYCSGGCDTAAVVRQIEATTGMTMEAYDGVYHAEELWIRHLCEGVCLPDCAGRNCGTDGCGGTCGECTVEGEECNATGQCWDPYPVDCGTCPDGTVCDGNGQCVVPTGDMPECDGPPDDPHYCLAVRESGAVLFGLESGRVCSIGPQDGRLTSYGIMAHSIAWQGDDVFMCNPAAGFDGMMRYSLVDGSYDIAPFQGCTGVATWNGGLLALAGLELFPFADFDAVKAGIPQPLAFTPHKEVIAVRGDTLYGAWHSTDQVGSFHLPDGAAGPVISMEAYDTWVHGLAVTDDDLLVVNGWPFDHRIAIFDAKTGAALWNLADLSSPVGNQFTGLVCRTRETGN